MRPPRPWARYLAHGLGGRMDGQPAVGAPVRDSAVRLKRRVRLGRRAERQLDEPLVGAFSNTAWSGTLPGLLDAPGRGAAAPAQRARATDVAVPPRRQRRAALA